MESVRLANVHALYNILIALLFLLQAALGVIIRLRRKRKTPPSPFSIRTHRKIGPFLVAAGIFGALSGWGIVLFNYGSAFHHPYHSFTGMVITFALLIVFILSKKIKGMASRARTLHFMAGLGVLILYAAQIYFGIRILY